MNRETLYRQDAITVWAWRAVPEEFRVLSQHGGDEDWCAYVPAPFVESFGCPEWLERLGVCDTSRHELTDGSLIFIGAHA